jgi:hypothetical protein
LEVGFFDGIISNEFAGGDLRTRKRGKRREAVKNWSPKLLTKR